MMQFSFIPSTQNRFYGGLLILLFLLLSPALGHSAKSSNFHTIVQKCSVTHNHDPKESGRLGAHQLGKNERAFLECLYQGIQNILMPQSVVPKGYEALITKHRQMTNDVEDGEMTRLERLQRTQEILDQIKDSEVTETERRIKELSIKRDKFLRERERMLKRKPWMF